MNRNPASRHLSGIPNGNDIDSMNAHLIADPSDYLSWRSPSMAVRLAASLTPAGMTCPVS
jgi:hypothetical protein